MSFVVHPLPPIYNSESEILLLGSMPSPKSREYGFYYANPQNRFWRVLSLLYGCPIPQNEKQREQLILSHHLALWDVLHSCEIRGADDSSIQTPVANDLMPLLHKSNIRAIFTTGTAAARLYRLYCEPHTGMPARVLPSTSPANCKMNLQALVKAYSVLLSV